MRTVYACVDARGRLLEIFDSFHGAYSSLLAIYPPPGLLTAAVCDHNHAPELHLREGLDSRVIVCGNYIGAIRTMVVRTSPDHLEN